MNRAKRNDSGVTGILLIDKPQGISSHGVVSRARKWLGTRKVGHAGTLDPMATGLLVLGAGKGTKLLTYLVGCDKTYTATIRLGASTPTDDADSEPDVYADPAAASRAFDPEGMDARLEAAMAPLRGDIEQVPSAVSAIKVDGKRSYARVRAGEDVVLKARPVTVSRFDVTAPPRPATDDAGHVLLDVEVVVDCTSGTYIRALARDLGESLGVGGHLVALRRTRVGGFSVDDAQPIPEFADMEAEAGAGVVAGEDVEGEAAPGGSAVPQPRLLSLAVVAAGVMPSMPVDAERAVALAQGKVVRIAESAPFAGTGEEVDTGDGVLVAVLAGDRLVAVATLQGGLLRTETGFLTPEQLEPRRASSQ